MAKKRALTIADLTPEALEEARSMFATRFITRVPDSEVDRVVTHWLATHPNSRYAGERHATADEFIAALDARWHR